jgi:hypothetical protein
MARDAHLLCTARLDFPLEAQLTDFAAFVRGNFSPNGLIFVKFPVNFPDSRGGI